MDLKTYQTETLSVLRRFLERARIAGPADAYEAITREPEQAKRLGGYAGKYKPLAELPGAPYVCLRLPTGGGKTILAAHAIATARDAWMEKDWPTVLWLVPTQTIQRQTVQALKNPRHPYRRALDENFAGRVRVFDIGDFVQARPHDLRDNLCVFVATIQTLRVTDTKARKVYAHNEELEPHFSAVPKNAEGLETLEGGGIKFSFANLMHVHRPLMIVDEAQNAVTGLTRETQARVNPCAIVEFTATPRPNSNILHSVAARELKQAEMVKLPIVLAEHDNWQNAVNGAVAARAQLAETAERDPDFIRPIALFQAQPKDQEVTVEALKKHLVEVEGVPEGKIAIATGDQRELDGIDLFDPECRIEHVITVEALKEGWDCSFAYVFCSVARIRSAGSVEQLLGRVLRMPYARRRKDEALNRAYAFLSEPSFGEAARALADRLIAMGFEEEEAEDNIRPAQHSLELEGGLFGGSARPAFTHNVAATPEVLSAVKGAAGVAVREIGDGRAEIIVAGAVDAGLEKAISDAMPEAERKGFADAVTEYRVRTAGALSPAERGEEFRVPRLMAEIQGRLDFAETSRFMDDHEWSLLDYPSKLTEAEFAIRETGRRFEIDLDGDRVRWGAAGETEQLSLDIEIEGWTPDALVAWLERQTRHGLIHPRELRRWLSDMVHHLTVARGISIAALMRCKFILARKARDRIADIRQRERERVYQRCLFAPEARVELSLERGFVFGEGMYDGERRHRGRWKPAKHYLGPANVPAFDGAENGDEEKCAQALDSLPEVEFWIRNVARHPRSFRLPVAAGNFYPDFVARLKDGRLLIVEYKGALLADGADTAEKRAVGALWERQSDGKGLFVIVEKTLDGRDPHAQLAAKIG